MKHVSLLLALCCLSISSGWYVGYAAQIRRPVMTLEPDNRPIIPVVQIAGIRNGLLHGTITGSARVSIGSQVYVQSGAFAFDASELLKNEVWVRVPADAKFVASKRGKKYYDLHSAAGERIVPTNRRYFATEQAARQAGYVR